jgi:flagellar biosynthesis protein FlhB
MNREQDLDRNEQATPFKLQEAKKKGATAKSMDATSLAVIVVAAIACFGMATSAIQAAATLLAKGLATPVDQHGSLLGTIAAVEGLSYTALSVIAPLLFAVVVAVVASGLLQSGGVFSTTPLKPDVTRLNPVTGFKRLFSVRLLYEGIKSTLKLAVLAVIAGLALWALLPGAEKLLASQHRGFLFTLADQAGGLIAKMAAGLAFFAAVDLVFARWDFMRNLRMSRREIEDEVKHREGDPRIRARLRELRMQLLQRARSVAKVPQADVLITNPTHYAVALRYEHGKSPAPQVLAKGRGLTAWRMRELAYKARVPIVSHPPLARTLYKAVDADGYVPEQWYPQVAKILVWLQASRGASFGNKPRERA